MPHEWHKRQLAILIPSLGALWLTTSHLQLGLPACLPGLPPPCSGWQTRPTNEKARTGDWPPWKRSCIATRCRHEKKNRIRIKKNHTQLWCWRGLEGVLALLVLDRPPGPIEATIPSCKQASPGALARDPSRIHFLLNRGSSKLLFILVQSFLYLAPFAFSCL